MNQMTNQTKHEEEHQPPFPTPVALDYMFGASLEQGSCCDIDDDETEPEPESGPLCENCADRPAVAEVEDSDRNVGYYSTLELCEECAMEVRR